MTVSNSDIIELGDLTGTELAVCKPKAAAHFPPCWVGYVDIDSTPFISRWGERTSTAPSAEVQQHFLHLAL